MILRIDRLQTQLPPPSEPDPRGAAVVQELMGGKFGELSTWLNYTFQSFNFRSRQGARPFYDLLCSIATEEFGHVELVAATINTLLTDPAAAGERAPAPALADLAGIGNPHHFIAGGRAALPQNSQGRPWNGDYVFSSGDLIEDLTHNFFLETGARNNKLKVYEMVEHPAARTLTGYLLVRGGLHQVAYARALENLTGSNLMKLFPTPRIPTDKIPESKIHIDRGEHLKLYRFSQDAYNEVAAVWNGPHPETGEPLVVAEEPHPEGAPAHDLPPQPDVFAPSFAPEEIVEIAAKLRAQAGLPKSPSGEVSDESADLAKVLHRSAKRTSSRQTSSANSRSKSSKARAASRTRSKK
jgi:Mn-containing catalase